MGGLEASRLQTRETKPLLIHPQHSRTKGNMSEEIQTLMVPTGETPSQIRFPMTQEDFEMLLKTLALWHKRIVPPEPQPQPFCYDI
jgi:hypothetical protein